MQGLLRLLAFGNILADCKHCLGSARGLAEMFDKPFDLPGAAITDTKRFDHVLHSWLTQGSSQKLPETGLRFFGREQLNHVAASGFSKGITGEPFGIGIRADQGAVAINNRYQGGRQFDQTFRESLLAAQCRVDLQQFRCPLLHALFQLFPGMAQCFLGLLGPADVR